jgi:peptidoglycan hydrolase-like protein with peptidoglycan-binding domain
MMTQQTTSGKSSFTPMSRPMLQRKCACGGTPGPSGECAACKKKREASQGMLQRAASNTNHVNEVPGIVHDVLRSSGQPLETGTREFMESRFGQDFSGVRVHTDSRAAESARAVNALAYTVGRNVVFDSGRYTPQTQAGQKLMAHELTHVVQQSQQPQNVMRKGLEVGLPDTAFERQADSMAEQIMQGSTQPQKADQVANQIMRGSTAQPSEFIGLIVQRKIGDIHDLTAQRFAGNRVLEAVFDNERVLHKGDSGTAVRLVQESLVAQGYAFPLGGADGVFGNETEGQVKQFQIDTGAIKIDGIVGPQTLQLLDMHDPGTTRASGRLAGPVPARAPAAPIATSVNFSEDPTELFAGYDNSVTPNWLVVPTNGRRRAAAAITPARARPSFVSTNTGVATVNVTAGGVVVSGVSSGTAQIQAKEGATVLSQIEVSVKNRLDRSVAFHYVCDSAVPPHCSNGAPSATDMQSLLNRVWERQANVRFTGGTSTNVVAPGDLGPAVDVPSDCGGEWNTVTALGTGAQHNVFRVWHVMLNGDSANDAVTCLPDIIIGDNPCADGLGLAHEAGHALASNLDHPDNFIMTPCTSGRADQRVSKLMVDKVNP